jgi:hypothetical protein
VTILKKPDFSQKEGSVCFLPSWYETMQNIKKIIGAVFEKFQEPTNYQLRESFNGTFAQAERSNNIIK